MAVAAWREHGRRVVVRFKGVDDRNGAEALRGHEILVHVDDLPEPDEHELYLYEVEGLTVLLEDGTTLGEVDSIAFPGGQEVWTILTPEGQEILFPVAQEFVPAVDLDQRTVTIAPPPGLLDIYLDSGKTDE
jgi:16S rRNA processing protein RimM